MVVSAIAVEISWKCLVVWLSHYIKKLVICDEQPRLVKEMLGSKLIHVSAKNEVEKKVPTPVRLMGLEESKDSLLSPRSVEKHQGNFSKE